MTPWIPTGDRDTINGAPAPLTLLWSPYTLDPLNPLTLLWSPSPLPLPWTPAYPWNPHTFNLRTPQLCLESHGPPTPWTP